MSYEYTHARRSGMERKTDAINVTCRVCHVPKRRRSASNVTKKLATCTTINVYVRGPSTGTTRQDSVKTARGIGSGLQQKMRENFLAPRVNTER